jgi:hypothetical protein
MALCCYLHTRRGEVTGISFIDSTRLRQAATRLHTLSFSFPSLCLVENRQSAAETR